MIIEHNRATLHELKTIYSLKDVYIMLETILVPLYNKQINDIMLQDEINLKRNIN